MPAIPHMSVATERKSGATRSLSVCRLPGPQALRRRHIGMVRNGTVLAAQFSQEGSGKTMDALLTDGNERAALAAARSLVRAGLEVGVAAGRGRRFCLAGVSRGVRCVRLSTDPLLDPAGYAAEVGGLV